MLEDRKTRDKIKFDSLHRIKCNYPWCGELDGTVIQDHWETSRRILDHSLLGDNKAYRAVDHPYYSCICCAYRTTVLQ